MSSRLFSGLTAFGSLLLGSDTEIIWAVLVFMRDLLVIATVQRYWSWWKQATDRASNHASVHRL
jgi:hypothetical protein